ncbi:Ankyrin repeats (3 copies)/Ankyrin repeats (many copies)/Ankyrin repeat [Leishmania donovani]|uniref:Ankyrin_repeats_(3_copies)/Ankyrin_repeats_(Many_ copies)/Ankyrin_repeat_putative/Pfam:PF12796/Pfam:PF13637/P fam:PF00023 n=1 Tax=Leishmania donovani TaxID=5661 RepID=A0A6J8FMW4_LEIDO|nr:Ankyrin repeats (3 copies)/Ankyrin repeats (many copies)/Ankyrin repeat [Leishmania donovani]VDZ48624.1 Ankyrin_repeats_(3_copies)/Ankyrin_repeats_(many_copies)/Ankyrin_repeat_putative/Pfam:PF12796/Pfam:PF13637/Pfam:PF00023 [Leishmania donovani]
MDSLELVCNFVGSSAAEIEKVVEDKSFLNLCNRPLPNGQYPIHALASRHNAKGVELLLQVGVDANQASEEPGNRLGFTAAHYAAIANCVHALEVLKRYNADLDRPAADQWTPLHAATFRGRSAAVRALVELGVNIDCATSEGHTPLVFAVNLGRIKDARYLLQNNAMVQLNDAHHDNLLHYTLHYRLAQAVNGDYKLPDSQLDIAVLLVLNGVRPDEQNDEGDTPTRYVAATLPSLPKALDLIFANADKLHFMPTECNYLTLVAATTSFLVDKTGVAAGQAQTLVDIMAALEKERKASRPMRTVAADRVTDAAASPSLPASHPAVPAEVLDLPGGKPNSKQCPSLARAAKVQANEHAAENGGKCPHCPFAFLMMRCDKGTLLLVGTAFLLGYFCGHRAR